MSPKGDCGSKRASDVAQQTVGRPDLLLIKSSLRKEIQAKEIQAAEVRVSVYSRALFIGTSQLQLIFFSCHVLASDSHQYTVEGPF